MSLRSSVRPARRVSCGAGSRGPADLARVPAWVPRASSVACEAARELGEGFAELLWPTRCAGCDAPGVLLCDGCRADLPLIDQAHACPRCGAPFGSLVCTECTSCHADEDDDPPRPAKLDGFPWPVESEEPQPGSGAPEGSPTGSDATPDPPFPSDAEPPTQNGAPRPDAPAVELLAAELDGVCCSGVLAWPLDALVRTYKDAGERRLAPLLADLLAQALAATRSLDVRALTALAFVPATPQAFARRGFDHMEAVARPLASLLGLPLRDVLARGGTARDQRRLSRLGRLANARDDVVACMRLDGERVLLVDDVLTTGATMLACARALRSAGAASVGGACIARAW